MKTLKLAKPWRAPKSILPPGEYRIPGDVSLAHAKCARSDGCGEIVEAAGFRTKRGRPSRKSAAPENKAGEPAPENKTEVEPVYRGRQRAETDAGSGEGDQGI